jgi:L-threonylcarbamoyladenylate synthase
MKIVSIRFKDYDKHIPHSEQIILSKNANLNEAAQVLFSAMRTADKFQADLILAEKFPETGLGLAINDRLKRAELS